MVNQLTHQELAKVAALLERFAQKRDLNPQDSIEATRLAAKLYTQYTEYREQHPAWLDAVKRFETSAERLAFLDGWDTAKAEVKPKPQEETLSDSRPKKKNLFDILFPADSRL